LTGNFCHNSSSRYGNERDAADVVTVRESKSFAARAVLLAGESFSAVMVAFESSIYQSQKVVPEKVIERLHAA